MENKMNNLKVLCDVDGILCHFINGVLAEVNKQPLYNLRKCLFLDGEDHMLVKPYKEEQIIKDFRTYPFYGDWLEERIHKEGFCFNLPLIDGAKEFISHLRNDLNQEVLFVTSPYSDHRTWHYERMEYLKLHFDAKRDDVVFCRDKRFVMGKVLIDDNETNCVDWSDQNRKESILMSRPYNTEANLESKRHSGLNFVERRNSFDEIQKEVKNILGIK